MIFALLATASVSASGQPIKAYVANFVDFSTLDDLDPSTGVASIPPEFASCPFAPPNAVFSANFTSGLSYADTVLYGIEWEGGSGPDIYLYTMANTFCATGTRVAATTPVGFTNLESLAYCAADGFLYSVDFNFPSHTGRLIRINPATGAGTVVGSPMDFDVRIMGMTCDASGTLHAITAGHGGRPTELYTVDRNTGVAALVGATGTDPLTMESLELDTSGPAPRLLAAKTSLFEINVSNGNATQVGGLHDTIWSMAQIRNAQVADSDGDGVDDSADNCTDVANADQRDTDDDNQGNICDPDFDNSCLINFLDLQFMQTNFFSNDPDADLDGSGLANFVDLQIMQEMFFGPPGPSANGSCIN